MENSQMKTSEDARKCLVDRAIRSDERRGLTRFDSASYFMKNRPQKCTNDTTGNLRKLRQRSRLVVEEKLESLCGAQRQPQQPLPQGFRDSGLNVLTRLYAGTWAFEQTGNSEFSESISSGLSHLASACGKLVCSENDSSKIDPWNLTEVLSDNEKRAMAAIVAEMLLREMQTISESKNPVKKPQQPLSEATTPSSRVKSTQPKMMLPHPPETRPAATHRPHHSNRRKHSMSLDIDKENMETANLMCDVGTTLHTRSSSVASSPVQSPFVGEGVSYPPSKEFWLSLASSGMDKSPSGSFKMMKESNSSTNSITTA